jgi:hypothetical protein
MVPCRTICFLAAALALGAPPGAHAQGRPLNPIGRQTLDFGALLPGARVTVSRLDPANAGQFEVRGQRFTEVELVLTLPSAMISARGAPLPLEFGPADGGVSNSPAITTSTAFDPRVPLRWILPNNGRAYVFLGGSAVPGVNQPGGRYTGTIVLTVAYTGN